LFDLHALLTLIVLLAMGMAWFRHDQMRRRALVLARKACVDAGVQLLDETIGLRRMRLARDDRGWPQIHRVFAFEFSQSGNDRYSGWVEFAGDRVINVELDMSRPWFDSSKNP